MVHHWAFVRGLIVFWVARVVDTTKRAGDEGSRPSDTERWGPYCDGVPVGNLVAELR